MALRDLMSRLLAAILLCGTAARGEAMQATSTCAG